MSVNREPPNREDEVAQVLNNLLSTQYGLHTKDQDICNRLVEYATTMQGLTDEEKRILIERGLMDGADMKLMPADEFMYRDIITPAFWMKCLMALHEMIGFNKETQSGEQK